MSRRGGIAAVHGREEVKGRGVVAAGHPESAAAGAAVLRAGGNAVDAAVAAVLTSFAAEPLLTGLGSGGYLLVVPPGGEAVLLDFFVETPGRGHDPADHAPLGAVTVDFGDATQVFHVGAASCGTYGTPAGLAAAVAEFGRAPLSELAAPAVRLARAGVRVTPMQAYLYALLAEINSATPVGRARYLPGGRPPRTGDVVTDPELAEALERFGTEGAGPFYTGDVAAAVVTRCAPRAVCSVPPTWRPTRCCGAIRCTFPTVTSSSARTRRRARAGSWSGGRWPSWITCRARRTSPRWSPRWP